MKDGAIGIAGDSYYGRPVIKAAPWRWYVAAYLFVGGAAGAAAPLAFAARLRGERRLHRVLLGTACAGIVISPILLIADLRDPKRFYNMLRVFKPTSPMNMGTWLLTAFGGAVALATAADLVPALRPIGASAEAGATLFGPCVAVYTATLLANTAVPVWHDARNELPFIFGGGGLASAGSVALVVMTSTETRLARRAVVVGTALEFAALALMTKRLGPLVGDVYEHGVPNTLQLVARVCAGTSVLVTLFAPKNAALTRIGGVLGLIGLCAQRFSIFEAGKASANDPKYTVLPQRERLDAAGRRGENASG